MRGDGVGLLLWFSCLDLEDAVGRWMGSARLGFADLPLPSFFSVFFFTFLFLFAFLFCFDQKR